MSIVVPGGGDLTEFGRRLYRNLPINDQFDQQLPLEAAAVQSLRQVRTQAHLEGRQVPLISLSPSLTGALQESGNSSRIHDASDASSALLTASDWLESSGEDVVLLFEAHTAPQVVCTLLISEYRPALDNSRLIYARLTGAAQADAPITSSVVSDAIKEAHWAAGIPPMAIGLVMTPTLENPGNQQGLLNGLLEAFDFAGFINLRPQPLPYRPIGIGGDYLVPIPAYHPWHFCLDRTGTTRPLAAFAVLRTGRVALMV